MSSLQTSKLEADSSKMTIETMFLFLTTQGRRGRARALGSFLFPLHSISACPRPPACPGGRGPRSDFQSQRYSELTQGNQGRDLLVGGLYMRVVFYLEKLKQLTIFSFPPLSLGLGCLSVCLGLFGCLEFLNI